MALQLILGSAGSGKSHYIYEKIIQASIERANEQFLILVPDQFTMQIQMEMAARHPRGGLFNIDVSSFTRLAYKLFMETGCQLPPVLEDAGKTMVLKRVAQKKKSTAFCPEKPDQPSGLYTGSEITAVRMYAVRYPAGRSGKREKKPQEKSYASGKTGGCGNFVPGFSGIYGQSLCDH